MPLYRHNGVLIAKNNALAVGQPCCCSTLPFEPGNCDDCCDWPSELHVNVDFSANRFYLAMPGIYTRTGPVSYSGAVTLRRSSQTNPGRCKTYIFNSCGSFGSFIYIFVTVDFAFSGAGCLVSPSIGVEARGCFGGVGFENTVSTFFDAGGCCAGRTNGGNGYGIFGDLPNIEDNDVNFQATGKLLSSACRMNYQCSGSRLFQAGASQTEFSGGANKLRTESDCGCDSYESGSFVGVGGFLYFDYVFKISSL